MVLSKKTKFIEVHKVKVQRQRNCWGVSHETGHHMPVSSIIYKYRILGQNWIYNRCLQCFQTELINVEIDVHKTLKQLK